MTLIKDEIMTREEGEFSVFQFFPDGNHEEIRHHVSSEEATKAAMTYTTNPASKVGIVRRVIITDAGDYTVFEWKYGEGYVYPPDVRRLHEDGH
jgi:hypothetical protein